jgi:hypothetical protein
MDSSMFAELSAAAELVADYQKRVGRLRERVPTEREDLGSAIEEAERALGLALRAIRRAAKMAS